MNDLKNNVDKQFLPRHTEYIRNMSRETGRSYRELEAEWRKAERQFDFDRMRDPLKYANLRRMDGTVAQEISRRFEETVLRPIQAAEEEAQEEVQDVAQEEFGDKIEDAITSETMTEEETTDAEEALSDIDELVIEEDFPSEEPEPANVEEELEEEGTEGVPNKSLEQQRQMERPTEEVATSAEEVNQKES